MKSSSSRPPLTHQVTHRADSSCKCVSRKEGASVSWTVAGPARGAGATAAGAPSGSVSSPRSSGPGASRPWPPTVRASSGGRRAWPRLRRGAGTRASLPRSCSRRCLPPREIRLAAGSRCGGLRGPVRLSRCSPGVPCTATSMATTQRHPAERHEGPARTRNRDAQLPDREDFVRGRVGLAVVARGEIRHYPHSEPGESRWPDPARACHHVCHHHSQHGPSRDGG